MGVRTKSERPNFFRPYQLLKFSGGDYPNGSRGDGDSNVAEGGGNRMNLYMDSQKIFGLKNFSTI